MPFPTLQIGDLIAKMPIVQGGMGVGVSLSRLASAVAQEGGIGVVAGAMIGMKEPDIAQNPVEANKRALRNELRKAREATQGIIGVNVMVALTTFTDLVRTAIEEKADVVFSGAGLPLELPKILRDMCDEKRSSSAPNWCLLFPPPARLPSSPASGCKNMTTYPTPSWWKAPRRAGTWASRPKT